MIRNKTDTPRNIDTPKPIAPKAPSIIGSSTPKTPGPAAVIGPKIRFKGELVGEEDLLIQGQIDGTIDLRDNNLTIGGRGQIKANMMAKTITIEGKVEGDVFGKERIAIKSTSDVKGNLVAERITLEDGAKFKGSIDMDISNHKNKFEAKDSKPA